MAFRTILTIGLNPAIDKVMEVPGLRIGEHIQGRVRRVVPAGKAFNVSTALAAMGTPNCAMGFLGRESLEAFDTAARLAGVETAWTSIAARTRENLTLIDPVASSATHIRDAGPRITGQDIERISHQLHGRCGPGVLAVFCGSMPPGVSTEAFAGLLAICRERGAQVAVDTSGEPLARAAAGELYLLKPNAHELSELLGRSIADQNGIIAAGRALAERCSIVLITLGQRGAYAIADNQVWRARADLPAESIRSTVGCGDAFLAGFIAAQQQGAATAGALARAVALAAASALTDLPASFAPADYAALLASVRLELVDV